MCSSDLAVREAGGFFGKFAGGALEQLGGMFEDQVRVWRYERQVRLRSRVQEFLAVHGLSGPNKAVPVKLIAPIVNGASMEEDDGLQDRWAALLVNAGRAEFSGEVRRSHVDILERLTPFDAQIMDAIYGLPFDDIKHNGAITVRLPDEVRVAKDDGDTEGEPTGAVLAALANLARLGCVRPAYSFGGGEFFGRVVPTVAGLAFVEACRLPRT